MRLINAGCSLAGGQISSTGMTIIIFMLPGVYQLYNKTSNMMKRPHSPLAMLSAAFATGLITGILIAPYKGKRTRKAILRGRFFRNTLRDIRNS